MPETAVNKNHSFQSREHNVWRTGQIFPMKAETETHSVHQFSDYYFRLSVFPLDASHHLGTLFWRDDIHQSPTGNA